MLTVTAIVAVGAFALACVGAAKPPVLWAAVALCAVAELLMLLPK